MRSGVALLALLACALATVALRGAAARGSPPAAGATPAVTTGPAPSRGRKLEDLSWPEAEKLLTPERVVVIPLGAASKEHGPHLKLANDWLMAQYLRDRVLAARDVVVARTLGFHYYPAFTEYPGSISLRLETARDLTIDVCRSLARHGSRRFYVLNTGVSTLRALEPAAAALAADGVTLRYTNLLEALGPTEKRLARQEGGTHADELETSMMLVIAPETVDMRLAVKDYDAHGTGPLTRRKGGPGTYSPTGIWGDPTLADRAKGEQLVAALIAAVLADIDRLAAMPPPPSARRD